MRNAYLILAHSDPVHLRRLVSTLNENDDVYIHLDQKADIAQFRDIAAMDNVVFTEKRFWVIWAGITMVDAMLELMRCALSSGRDYGHLGILTGSDYPLKSAEAIRELLAKDPERELIKFSHIYESKWYTSLIKYRYFRDPFLRTKNKSLDKVDRAARKLLSSLHLPGKWRKDVEPYRGHTWCMLTASCCRYILDYVDGNPWYHDMNIGTFAPDEHYFHTIIGNSRFAENSLGFQTCTESLERMATTHLIDASLVHWFTLDDWGRIENSDRLFVRKVRSLDGGPLLDRIDERMRNSQTLYEEN